MVIILIAHETLDYSRLFIRCNCCSRHLRRQIYKHGSGSPIWLVSHMDNNFLAQFLPPQGQLADVLLQFGRTQLQVSRKFDWVCQLNFLFFQRLAHFSCTLPSHLHQLQSRLGDILLRTISKLDAKEEELPAKVRSMDIWANNLFVYVRFRVPKEVKE